MTAIPRLSMLDIATPLEGGLLASVVRAGASDAEKGTTFFVMSTDDEDRALDVVNQRWRLRNFRANPVVLDNHNGRRVVGVAEGVKVPKSGDDAGRLVGTVRWDLANPDETIAAVGWQHVNGFRRAGSVGFRPGKTVRRNELPKDHPKYSEGREVETPWGSKARMVGRYLDDNELLEYSSASIPMNPNALQRSYLEELAAVEPEDVVGRASVVAETVPKAVGSGLVDMARALEGDELVALVDLLWPDVVRRLTRDEQARLAIQTAVALTVRGPAAPPEAPASPFDGGHPLDFLFAPVAGINSSSKE